MPSKVASGSGWRFPEHDLAHYLQRELDPYLRQVQNAINTGLGRVKSVTASDACTAEFQYYLVDATAGSVTITLPDPNLWLMPLVFKRLDASGNTVMLAGVGGELIDGSATRLLSSQYEAVTLVSDEVAAWYEV